MGLTSAMYTGLSGLTANQSRIDTIGNNIANVNTTAFKASRSLFQTQFYNTLSRGSAPSDATGGVNPMQYGLGVNVGSTQRIHTPGSIETTGVPSDVAVEGTGMFIVRDAAGRQMYTRDGSFSMNPEGKLVTMDGNYVRGFGVDSNFVLDPGTLGDIVVPLGTETVARPTQSAWLDGDLSAAGTIATQGSTTTSGAMVDGGGGAATGGTALTDLRSDAAPGVAMFAAGDAITVTGATKGGREVPPQQFIVGTTGNTLGDFASWLQTQFGIQTDPALAGTPGVTVEGGALVIRSNAGEANGIEMSSGNIRSANPGTPLPFSFSQTQEANGESVYTSYMIYDSLGSPVQVRMTFALDSTPSSGPIWRYYLESPDASGSPVVGTGTATFDNFGNLVGMSQSEFTIDRSSTGAATPIVFTLDLSSVNGLSTETSNVVLGEQDGFPPGALDSYSIGPDGVITGAFSNGLTRPLGQVALAMFTNETGLLAEGNNLYVSGPNSTEPRVVAPGSFGAGTILGGALEQSNVDLSREFIGLITSSTGFQAASRVISVSNEMLDNLLLILR